MERPTPIPVEREGDGQHRTKTLDFSLVEEEVTATILRITTITIPPITTLATLPITTTHITPPITTTPGATTTTTTRAEDVSALLSPGLTITVLSMATAKGKGDN